MVGERDFGSAKEKVMPDISDKKILAAATLARPQLKYLRPEALVSSHGKSLGSTIERGTSSGPNSTRALAKVPRWSPLESWNPLKVPPLGH